MGHAAATTADPAVPVPEAADAADASDTADAASAQCALEGSGLQEVAAAIDEHRALADQHGQLSAQREDQQQRWLWEEIGDELRAAFRAHTQVQQLLGEVEGAVRTGALPAGEGARRLLEAFRQS